MIKKIKYLLFCFLLLLLFLPATAQDTLPILPKPSRHSINLELGGGSIVYSLGYEYTFSVKEKTSYSITTSVGYLGLLEYIVETSLKNKIIFPIAVNMIKGNKKIKYYGASGYTNLFDLDPTPRWRIKKIKNNDPEYIGASYQSFYAAMIFLNQGVEYNSKNIFLRWYISALMLVDSGNLSVGPWIGITMAKKIK